MLLLNIGNIFGSKQHSHELSEEEKEALYNEMAAKKSADEDAEAVVPVPDEPVAESKRLPAEAQARNEILELVKKKDLAACRAHDGWKKYLAKDERYDVEAVLNLNQYSAKARPLVSNYIGNEVDFAALTWDRLADIRNSLRRIAMNAESASEAKPVSAPVPVQQPKEEQAEHSKVLSEDEAAAAMRDALKKYVKDAKPQDTKKSPRPGTNEVGLEQLKKAAERKAAAHK